MLLHPSDKQLLVSNRAAH